jgi:tetratricopeptide (TPR) repeat protein
LNEAVRLNPFDPVALNNLAVNYAATGDYQNAVALLERAQRIAPNRVDIVNNLANLKAWMAQDSQFATGNRGVPQALNFPRAEDTPPELPPLWAGPGTAPYPQSPPIAGTVPAPGYLPQQAPAYQQPAYQQPVYQQPAQPYAQPTYTAPARQAQPSSAAATTGSASTRAAPAAVTSSYTPRATAAPASQSRQTIITERLSDYVPVRKKKKVQALDCPVP